MEIATPMIAAQQATFSALLEQHRRIMLKVAHSYCADPEQRADLIQEIATQLWRAYPRYDPSRSFTTWMYRIALNVAIAELRGATLRRRHQVPYEPTEHEIETPGPDPELNQQVAQLQRFMASLDPLNRALLLLYLEAHSSAEIAEVLGISESNVSTRVSRLKQRIRCL